MSTEASTGGTPQSTGAPASSGAAQSTGVAQVMGWGDDWRQRMAGGSTDVERDVKQLERYESPEQVWKKARELEKKISSGELRTQLPKGASPEEVIRWRAENGIPAKPEDYKVNMPAGRQPPPDDDAFLKSFLKSAHEGNYTQAQVDGAIKSFYAEVDKREEELTAEEAKKVQETEDKLHQEWGADFRVNKQLAANLLARAPAGFSDKFLKGYLEDRTPIRASVEAWKWLVQLEREINPAGTVVPGHGGDPGKSIAEELKTLLADSLGQNGEQKKKEYWSGEGEKRYRELIDARDKMKAKAA